MTIAMTDMATETKILGLPTLVNNTSGRSFLLNQRVGKLCKFSKDIYVPYLRHILTAQDVIEYYKSKGAGGLQINISKKDILSVKFPLPAIPTQQKIVAKLDAIFAEIDKATAAAEANAKNAEALFQSYLTEIFERGGEGWETKKLCEVSSFDKNQGLHNGIPYIGMENIQSHTTQLISGVELVEEVKSSTFKFNETHLLYGRLRPYLNKVYAPDFVGHCSTEIFPIKPFSNLLRAYLKYWFINVKTVDRINATCTGARMPRANMNAVMDFDFPLPPISIQKQLIEYFDSVQNFSHIAIDSYKAKIAEITALKQSILQKAFSGELVKD
jgi:type I restriction enzyme, S subunit